MPVRCWIQSSVVSMSPDRSSFRDDALGDVAADAEDACVHRVSTAPAHDMPAPKAMQQTRAPRLGGPARAVGERHGMPPAATWPSDSPGNDDRSSGKPAAARGAAGDARIEIVGTQGRSRREPTPSLGRDLGDGGGERRLGLAVERGASIA
jgi:hypothetical protein